MDATTIDLITKLGMGGAGLWFALQIYDRTITFLGKRPTVAPPAQGDFGGQPKEFWIAIGKEIVADAVKDNIQTFAAHPDNYWRNMDSSLEKSVTKPLGGILDQQTKILERLADYKAKSGRR